jgi:hypothetical protein
LTQHGGSEQLEVYNNQLLACKEGDNAEFHLWNTKFEETIITTEYDYPCIMRVSLDKIIYWIILGIVLVINVSSVDYAMCSLQKKH